MRGRGGRPGPGREQHRRRLAETCHGSWVADKNRGSRAILIRAACGRRADLRYGSLVQVAIVEAYSLEGQP